ncbi:energy transducer TonB [Dyella humicola]|uniref:energy transducer TonB n=1 Tax=Dyella humicola TaxID=2992126 RepID=UPI00225B6BC7|nr:energy transducer TonB [Dyella humicola]
MSSASLAVPRIAHPDSVRIAALSAAIALNLAALLAVMRPLAPHLAEQVQRLADMQIHWVTTPPEVKPPPTLDIKPLVQPKPMAHPQVQPRPVVAPEPMASDDSPMAVPTVTPTMVSDAPDTGAQAAPVEATLAYKAVPLKYPPQALHAHMEGTVLLRVLVDEQGVPQDVVIAKSSGYALLDRSAREQVLKGWKFEPAMANGRAIRAWARVPVSFNLNEL